MNNRQNKRGQITSFIIVGIVILFILAFTMYFIATIKNQQLTIETVPEKGNLRACLEQALDLSIHDVAEHGGTIFTPPLGIRVYLNSSTTTTDVRFGIRAGTPVQPGSFVAGVSQFGTVNMQSLCLLRGPNRPNAGRNFQNDCLAGTYQLLQPDTEVLQQVIAEKTSANAILCGVNNSVTITLGTDDVTAVAGNLSVKSDARLKRLYNAAFALALADTKDVYFDKRTVTSLPGCLEPKTGNECLLPGMIVNTRADRQGVNLFEVTDTTSKTLGSLTLRYAVENRAPVITDFTRSTVPGQPFVVTSDEQRELFVDAADADELDKLTFGCQGPLWAYCEARPSAQGMHIVVTLSGCKNGASDSSTVFVTVSDGKTATAVQFPVLLEPLPDDQECTSGYGVMQSTVHPQIAAAPANAYLLDASMAMYDAADDGGNIWDIIASYPFSTGELFMFNDHVNPLPQPIGAPSDLSSVTLNYGAPLYDATWNLLQQSGRFDSITIVTANADTSSSKTGADVLAAAAADNTRLNSIVIGLVNTQSQVNMMDLAVQSGGTFYIRS